MKKRKKHLTIHIPNFSYNGRYRVRKNMRFNKLVASCLKGRDKRGNWIWEFICDCSSSVEAKASDVFRGRIASCGCECIKNRKAMRDFYIYVLCASCGKSYRTNHFKYPHSRKLCKRCNNTLAVKLHRLRKKGINNT